MTTLLVMALALGGAASRALPAQDGASPALLARMTQGKLDTDLGLYDSAIAAFTAVAEAGDAPPALRTEALVRLGVARREKGDWEAAFRAFERASKDAGLDRDTKALLVRGVGGFLPADDRWDEIWDRVAFLPDRSNPKRPTLDVRWPGVPRPRPDQLPRDESISRITLDFHNGDLHDIFRLFADISGLNVVVFPGTRGLATLKVNAEPWPDVLWKILAPSGYSYEWNDVVLVIGRPEDLPPPHRFTGRRIDLELGPGSFRVEPSDGERRRPSVARRPDSERERDEEPTRSGQGVSLTDALERIAAAGDARVELDPGVAGHVTLKLNQVRWDHAFDVLVRVNGLDWTREGDTLRVFPRSRS